jgi:hypothetical protein
MARIGQILVSLGATSENNVARALGVQGFAGGRLGTLLLERGVVSEDDLGEALAQQHGRPYAPWTQLGEVPPDVIAALPAKFAIRHAAVPYDRGESYLKIALRDPSDLRILDELFFVTGKKIIPAVAPEARIYHALEKYYGERRTPRFVILGEKLEKPSARRRTKAAGPPPPPDFFPSGQQPAPPPKPHEVWGDSADGEPAAAPPIIQRFKIPDAPASPWARPAAPPRAPEPAAPEEESITWDESPPPSLWLPEGAPRPAAAEAPASGEASGSSLTPPSTAIPEIFVSAAPPAPPPAAVVGPPPPPPEPPRSLPLETDFPEVLAAKSRDEVAAAALSAMLRRFGRAAFLVARPNEVAGHSAAGPGIDREAFRAIAIPWSEPSIFLNVKLSRSFYLGPLPPLPRHRALEAALGGMPEECVVQPVLIKDKPVAFLFAEFGRDHGASPMDLAYLRGLGSAAARALAATIRQRKKEPV